MAKGNLLKNLSVEQTDLGVRVFDLVIGRVLKRVYANFDEKGKADIEKVFLSDEDKEKEKFIKKYIPDFKKIFKEEAKKIEEEIKSEIEKQI